MAPWDESETSETEIPNDCLSRNSLDPYLTVTAGLLSTCLKEVSIETDTVRLM
jgi:hypothetical protein